MIQENKNLDLLQKFFIVFVILSSGTALSIDTHITLYSLAAIFVLLVITGNLKIKINIVFVALISAGFLFLQYLTVNKDWNGFESAIKTFLVFTMCLIFTSSGQIKAKISFFAKVLLAFSIFSNIVFLLVLLKIPVFTFIPSQISNLKSFIYLANYNEGTNYGIFGFRNAGIYWEPGMYQIYLNFLFIWLIYFKPIKNKAIKILTLINIVFGVLSTGSIGGYALLIALVVLFALFNNQRNIIFKFLIVLVVTLSIVLFLPIVNDMWLTKITIGQSYSHRLDDLQFGFNFFLRSPIIGVGLDNNAYNLEYYATYGILRGNTNGFISLLIELGIIGLIFYAISFYSLFSYLKNEVNKKIMVPLIVWLVVSLNMEPFFDHTVIFFFLGAGIYLLSSTRKNKKRAQSLNKDNGKRIVIEQH